MENNGWIGQAPTTETRNINSYFGRAINRCRKVVYPKDNSSLKVHKEDITSKENST